MPVLAGHPRPQGGGVLDVERLPKRFSLHVDEPGGAMDRRCLLGVAEATEGARVVCVLGADDRGGGGAGEREPRVRVEGAHSAVTMRPPAAVTRRNSRSVTTGSPAIISARRLTTALNRPSENGSTWSKSASISVT